MSDNQVTNEEKGSEGKFNPVTFVDETRREVGKVTWPTRKETVITTVMIVVMALMAGVFFYVVDFALGTIIGKFLGMSS